MSTRTPLAERINTKRGETTHTGTILEMVRLNSSVNGNPAWRVTITALGELGFTTFRTQVDSSVSYEIDNYRKVTEPVTLGLTKAGRIFAIEVAR